MDRLMKKVSFFIKFIILVQTYPRIRVIWSFIFCYNGTVFLSFKKILNLRSSNNVNALFNTLKQECLIYLSQRTVTQENLQEFIQEFLYSQPEHLLLILAKEVQHNDAISTIMTQSKPYQSNILIDRIISHLNDILYKLIKPDYFQIK